MQAFQKPKPSTKNVPVDDDFWDDDICFVDSHELKTSSKLLFIKSSRKNNKTLCLQRT
jgi:hypothetical protein